MKGLNYFKILQIFIVFSPIINEHNRIHGIHDCIKQTRENFWAYKCCFVKFKKNAIYLDDARLGEKHPSHNNALSNISDSFNYTMNWGLFVLCNTDEMLH